MGATPINWNFFRNRVQPVPHGQFISGRSIIIGAGPPNIATLGTVNTANNLDNFGSDTSLVYLIGITQQMSIAQAANVQRFFEIGSVRQYFITGHTLTTIQLNRILYHGPNLLRTLYAHYSSANTGPNQAGDVRIESLLSKYSQFPTTVNNHTVQINPGDRNFFINLGSDLFSQPMGLLFIVQDQNELNYGMFYAENCYADNYVFSTDSTSILVTETVNIQCERLVPVGSAAADLVQLLDQGTYDLFEVAGDATISSE